MRDPVDAVFAALADPSRRFVLETLASQGTATPTELAPVVQAWGRVRELDRFADLPANPGWMRG